MGLTAHPMELLWKDRCSIYQQQKVTNPDTKLTKFVEVERLADLPCKLSFESLNATMEGDVATISQRVKLFLSVQVVIPAGSKIVVNRGNPQRTFVYAQSGEAGIFTHHQEIQLIPFRGYA